MSYNTQILLNMCKHATGSTYKHFFSTSNSMCKHREKYDNFSFGLLTKKVKRVWYFSNKNIVLNKFCNFGPIKKKVIKMRSLICFFKSQKCHISVTGQHHSKFLHFYFFKGVFCSTPQCIFRWCSLFWSPWPPCISTFQPASLLQLFQPSNHFDQKKCVLGVKGMVWYESIQDWWFWAFNFHVWALKYVHMSSYFTHIYIFFLQKHLFIKTRQGRPHW